MSGIQPNAVESAGEIGAQAAALLERRDFEDWNKEDEAALDAWLAQSQAHRAAFWRLEAAWNHTRRLAALNSAAIEQTSLTAKRAVSPWLLRAAAAFVIATTLGIGAAYVFSNPQERVFTTGVGGHETVSFADGSRIELNTDTVLRARMTTAQRIVWLDKGEAYFTVKHDATHPFIVIAGNHRVTDLGTKFLVHRRSGAVEVALLEGSAEFSTANVQARAQSALLMPGDVAVGTVASISVTKKSAPELSRELGWRSGVLVFKHTALADAVAEFNRYNREKLVIADPQAGQLTIGGTFKAQHVEDFTQLVRLVLGLHVENKGTEIVISR
jgi:transmembrane sensor